MKYHQPYLHCPFHLKWCDTKRFKSRETWLFSQQFVAAKIKETPKLTLLDHCGESSIINNTGYSSQTSIYCLGYTGKWDIHGTRHTGHFQDVRRMNHIMWPHSFLLFNDIDNTTYCKYCHFAVNEEICLIWLTNFQVLVFKKNSDLPRPSIS